MLARCANSEGLLITVLSNTYSLVAIRTRTFHDIYTVHVSTGNTGHGLFVYTFVRQCRSRSTHTCLWTRTRFNQDIRFQCFQGAASAMGEHAAACRRRPRNRVAGRLRAHSLGLSRVSGQRRPGRLLRHSSARGATASCQKARVVSTSALCLQSCQIVRARAWAVDSLRLQRLRRYTLCVCVGGGGEGGKGCIRCERKQNNKKGHLTRSWSEEIARQRGQTSRRLCPLHPAAAQAAYCRAHPRWLRALLEASEVRARCGVSRTKTRGRWVVGAHAASCQRSHRRCQPRQRFQVSRTAGQETAPKSGGLCLRAGCCSPRCLQPASAQRYARRPACRWHQ